MNKQVQGQYFIRWLPIHLPPKGYCLYFSACFAVDYCCDEFDL